MEIKVGTKTALVDDQDFERISKYKWHLHKTDCNIYAARWDTSFKPKKKIFMHREILGLDPISKMVVDHINHNGLDNRRDNIRVCTRSQNQMNRYKGKNTGYYPRKDGKFVVQVRGGGKRKSKICNTESEAITYRDQFVKELHGEFAVN